MDTWTVSSATLVDLLDRLLDRGLVVNADIVICLAGVPLIGINLRAALAGMETMIQYGLMTEWDQRIRSLNDTPDDQAGAHETPVLVRPGLPLTLSPNGGEGTKITLAEVKG